MKIAIVHELLTMKGGAERVARVFADMFPQAPIYTLLYNKKKLGDWFPTEQIRPAKLPMLYALAPSPFRHNHHLYLRHFPKMVESWDFSGFDLVIGSSSAFAHGIITNGSPKHLCYVHSPARYLWDRTHDVRSKANPLARAYLDRLTYRLRTWDSEAADRPDKLISASAEVQRRIELYWRREADIIHPPLDDFWLTEIANHQSPITDKPSTASKANEANYYLIVSTLSRYKNIELAIEACNKTSKKLKIVGEGPDRSRLQKLAGPTVEFLGYRSNEELKDLYSGASATLFVGDEDFGIVPLESMSCGTPVIGYRKGGALESIDEGETGEFFSEPTADAVADAMQRLEGSTYDAAACKKHAEQFSRERFESAIRSAIDSL